MKNLRRDLRIKHFPTTTLIFAMALCVALPHSAKAYIDPAATSYLLQIVGGIVIACSVTIGVFWRRIQLFFSKKKMQRLEKRLSKQAEQR